MPVIATGASSRTEPTISWNTTVPGFDALAVRRQLGVTRTQYSIDARGILDLDPVLINAQLEREASQGYMSTLSRGVAYPKDNITSGVLYLSTLVPSTVSADEQTVSFCLSCTSTTLGGPNGKQSAIFVDTLQETGDPSRALQAHLTVLIEMAYMDFLPTFAVNETIFVSFFETLNAPTAHKGFWIVIVTLCTHLVAILLITRYFCIGTQYSSLGNAWQVLAQVVTAETKEVLQETTLATDTDVKKWLKRAGRVDDRVTLQPAPGSRPDDRSFSVHLFNVERKAKHPTNTEESLKKMKSR